MKSVYFLAAIAIGIASCSPSKKSTSTASSSPPPAQAATAPAGPSGPAGPPNNGVYAPGEAELAAVQPKYPDVTIQTLSRGHAIYTGACTSCHKPKSIYSRPESAWPAIINDMAIKTRLSESDKDAVYKYVMAIKATQTTQSR